jgi:hypothetical protein
MLYVQVLSLVERKTVAAVGRSPVASADVRARVRLAPSPSLPTLAGRSGCSSAHKSVGSIQLPSSVTESQRSRGALASPDAHGAPRLSGSQSWATLGGTSEWQPLAGATVAGRPGRK